MEEFDACSVCARTPLVGEGITVMLSEGRESVLCDLCRDRPRAAMLGEAIRRERVRSAAGATHVRRIWPSPAPEPSRPTVAR